MKFSFPSQLKYLTQVYLEYQMNPTNWFCSRSPCTTTWMVSQEHGTSPIRRNYYPLSGLAPL